MIGYMRPVKSEFSKADRQLYQSIYCGLCRCLKYEYRLTGVVTLNYEMVDVLLLLGALADEEYEMMPMTCSLTPLLWKRMSGINQNSFSCAAGMSIALTELKLQDNLTDGNRWIDRTAHRLMAANTLQTHQRYASHIGALQDAYNRFMDLENQAKCGNSQITFDSLMDSSGRIAAHAAHIVGLHANCAYLPQLFDIAHLWGKWVYLLDALDDWGEDQEKHRFNPLRLSDRPTSPEQALMELEAQANAVLDQLPLRRYESAVHSLFHIQLPKRRQLLLEKRKATLNTEGETIDTSV